MIRRVVWVGAAGALILACSSKSSSTTSADGGVGRDDAGGRDAGHPTSGDSGHTHVGDSGKIAACAPSIPAAQWTSPYAAWSRGVPTAPSFFPIAVWLQGSWHATELSQLGINIYIGNNAGYIVDYGERFRAGERISTGFVESAVNQIVDKRFDKRQSMRWTPTGAHMMLQTRTRVLNGDLDQLIRCRYPNFRKPADAGFAPGL